MGKTKIEWATDVWNPVTGCTKVREGCRNCYADYCMDCRACESAGPVDWDEGEQV